MARAATGPRRWWRWPLYLGLTLLVLLGLLLVVARTSFAREQVRTRVNTVLGSLFQGRIQLERIATITPWGVSGVDARIFDPENHQVIRVQGLRARASLLGIGYEFLTNSAEPRLDLAEVHVDFADVTLREDAEAGVTLASTFLPRPDEAASAPSTSSGGPHLHIAQVLFERIWVHGRVAGSPPLDADLLRLRASMDQSPRDGFGLELERVALVTRAMPFAADPRGDVSGVLEAPSGDTGPLRLEGRLDGSALGSPLALEVSWVGDYVHAAVRLLHAPAAVINDVSGLGLDGEVSVAADIDGPLPQLDFQAEVIGSGAHVTAAGYAVAALGGELSATVQATGVDLSRIAAGAPQSQLATRVDVLLFETDDGHFVGTHRLDVEPGHVAAQATPALWVTGRDELDTEAGVSSTGKLGVKDPGVSVAGQYRVKLPKAGDGSVAASLTSRLDDPERLARLGVHTAGTASVDVELRPEQRWLSGKASVNLSHVERGPVQARNVAAQAQVSGSFTDPHVSAAATLDMLSGRAHADLAYSQERTELKLFAADLDLVRLARLLGSDLPIKQGKLQVDAGVTRSARSPSYVLEGTAHADLGKLGALQVTANRLELPQGSIDVKRARALRGELTASGNVELEAVSSLLTAAQLPIERTTGHVRFELAAKQHPDDPHGLEVSLQVDTNGLRIVQAREAPQVISTTSEAIAAKPLALEGIDLHLSVRSWPATGDAVGTLILRDAGGTLAEAQAEAQLGPAWPSRIADAQTWRNLPLKGTLQVPERKLQSLPPLVRPAALRGRLALDAALEGSVASPTLKTELTLKSLHAAGAHDPLDVTADVTYAPDAGELRVVANTATTHGEVASLQASWRGDLRRAAQLGAGDAGIVANASAKLSDFPLDVVPLIADRQVSGKLTGDVELKDWGRDARVDAALRSTSLVLARAPIQLFDVKARAEQGKLSAELQVQAGAGLSKGSLDADMRWGKLPAPVLGHRGELKLKTVGFRLETLSPLLGAYVSEIGGVLDANTEIAVTPTQTTLSGSAKLAQGVVQVPSIGQRFSDISAQVSVENDRFKLEKLEAHGTTGRVSVTGGAQLDGFQLRSADARVVIDKNESLPITLEGAEIGDAWGNLTAKFASPAQGERKLDIDVEEFHLVTPETSGYGLQSLDAPKDVRIGTRRADGAFVALPVQPLEPGGEQDTASAAPAQPLRITVKLGRNVTVERGRTAQAQLSGQLVILSAGQTQVDGRIEVRGGKLDVQGKTFEIERGVVTFEGSDPGNPSIAATARWDAPGYTVYADYVGDVKDGRIKLHAEPPLTQDEIASLLLFGAPEGGAGGSADPNAAALAVSVAGDTAAKGLTRALDNFTHLDVSARIDTTTGSARPELVFQVSQRVSAKVTRAVGAPAAGESPDRTFLTLELRLRRAWALSAIFGDHGASALDLIWRRRY